MDNATSLVNSLPAPGQHLLSLIVLPGVADPVLLHQVELPEPLVVSDGEARVTGGPQSTDVLTGDITHLTWPGLFTLQGEVGDNVSDDLCW